MDKNDLISRSALLSHAIPVYGKYDDSAEFEAVPVNYIKGAPTIDPEELRPRGKWIWNPNGMDWGLGAWECSECACRNNSLPMNSNMNPLMFSGSNYCPNCGAYMREDQG